MITLNNLIVTATINMITSTSFFKYMYKSVCTKIIYTLLGPQLYLEIIKLFPPLTNFPLNLKQ